MDTLESEGAVQKTSAMSSSAWAVNINGATKGVRASARNVARLASCNME